ncbi:MAG: EcsC family protein [Deltaproteobacteria bacterium]|nr:EcsC family protein [Deltaproteobacteria bacterium]
MYFLDDDLEDLIEAKRLLESPSLASRMVKILGVPIEIGFRHLPRNWFLQVQTITGRALHTALNFAVLTLDDDSVILLGRSSDRLHRVFATVSGCVGGAFGLPALAVELPVTTTIMLRSIADIARSEGEDVKSIEARLACLEVFALGDGRGVGGTQTGYYVIRSALTRTLSEAAQHIVERGVADEAAPALVRLIATIAGRFGIVVTDKAAAVSIPIVGAASGAVVNTIFMNHFQRLARGHFTIRRLERSYGEELVRREYDCV